jgi:hypothetical protein
MTGNNNSWQQAVAWIEAEMGGVVLNARPQGRWRTAWFFDLQRGGQKIPLYFRGLRPGMGRSSAPLRLEMAVLQILERHGLPVPHVYGLCPEPPGIVMDCRSGRPNLATADSQQEREAVLDQYVDALVTLHAIDPEEFVGIGMQLPQNSDALCLGDLASWESNYRRNKNRPQPAIEFALCWLKQNIPAGRTRTACLHADAGQFIFDQGELTALLDFELCYLGDPAADLAGLRTRDISEPLGSLDRAYRRYREKTGEMIDPAVVDYHTVRFALMTPMATAHVCAQPPAGINLPQYLGWYLVYTRIALELIATAQGVSLQEPELPAATASRYSPSLQALSSQLETVLTAASDDPNLHYELDTAKRLVVQLQRVDSMGAALDTEDWRELVAVLGCEPGDWQAADLALEQLAVEPGSQSNADLLRYFYRHTVRQLHTLGPALRELEGSQLQALATDRPVGDSA